MYMYCYSTYQSVHTKTTAKITTRNCTIRIKDILELVEGCEPLEMVRQVGFDPIAPVLYDLTEIRAKLRDIHYR